jgi:hypothetical protein
MEAVKQLNSPNVYWTPCVDESPNVDSVLLLLGNTLYAFLFMYNNERKHHLNTESFPKDFVNNKEVSLLSLQ